MSTVVNNLSNKTSIFNDFQGPTIKFRDSPGLEMKFINSIAFQVFPWPVWTLQDIINWIQISCLINECLWDTWLACIGRNNNKPYLTPFRTGNWKCAKKTQYVISTCSPHGKRQHPNKKIIIKRQVTWSKCCNFIYISVIPQWRVLNRFNGAIKIPVWAIYNREYRKVSIWLFQKLLTASINVIKHLLKIRNVTLIRILYYSLSFRIVSSKQLHFGSSATVSGPEELIQIYYIALIKSEYNIKITKTILAYLSCFVVIWNSMILQNFQTSADRSKSFVEVQYSSAIDFPFTSFFFFF